MMLSLLRRSFVIVLVLLSCGLSLANKPAHEAKAMPAPRQIGTLGDLGSKIIQFATQLLGTPYRYAGKDTHGFDCSGFVYYVFKNHKISVPPSSKMLASIGSKVEVADAKPGDIILFTGTAPGSTEIGHVGIVVENLGTTLKFIHCSSAKDSYCVTYDLLSKPNYARRFVMIKRVLN